MKPLGEIVKILKGSKAPEVFDEPKPGAYPYLQIEDLRPDATPKYAIDKDGTLATKSDVLIAWDGANAGTVGFDLEGYVGSTIAILRPVHDDIHAPYLGYFLRSKFNEIQENATGATIPHVGRNYLENLKLPIPPLTEQKRIASLLARAERLRQLRRAARDLGDSLLQSVFLEMFGEYIYSGDFIELGDEITLGPTNGIYKSEEYFGSGTLLLDIKGLYKSYYADFRTARRIQTTDSEFNKYKVAEGDILINRVSKVSEGVGKAVLVRNPPEPFVYESNMMRFRVNPEKLNGIFLVYYLASEGSRKDLISKSNISNQASINQETVRSLKIPVPPLNLQAEFAGMVARVEGLRGRMSEAGRQVEGLFGSLLAEAFK